MKMFNPMLIWYAVAAGVILAIVIEFISQLYHRHRIHHQHTAHHHLIGTLHERDLFYIPGDIRYNDQDDDFDDC